MEGKRMKSAPIDKQVFWPALLVVLAAIVPLMAFPDQSAAVLDQVMSGITHSFGFLFLWFTFACLAVLLWFALGKYGSVRFGGEDATPEFRTLSWIAMLFCAGIGTSLLYWATIEWVYYYQAPPFGIEAESAEAAHWAAMYGLFHWGPMAWALYCMPALPIAYAFHNRKIPFLRISQACRGVIGDRADGWLGKLIDVLFIFGLVGGTGTSLGLGTPILSESISTLTGIARTFALDAFVIVIWTVIFGTTVYLGMEKGIKRLADANVYLGFFLLAFVLIFGPTVFILDPRHLHQQPRPPGHEFPEDELLHRSGRRVGFSSDLDCLLLGVVDRLRPVHGPVCGANLEGADDSPGRFGQSGVGQPRVLAILCHLR
jgi:BCCT family betaine/carnitine transporter